MALSLDTPLDIGATASYYKVSRVFLDFRDETRVSVEVSLYMDSKARTDGKVPVKCDSYTLEVDPLTTNVVAAAYSALKALPGFTGAKDA